MSREARWTGNWEYRNPTDLRLHGKRGTLSVYATSEDDAEYEIKQAVSCNIIGTTSFVSFVHVTNIRKEG